MGREAIVAEINNTPAHPHDIPIECSKVRKCGWKGMESDLADGGPMKGVKQSPHFKAIQRVCPKCGCTSYYRRDIEGDTR